ncbi:phosphohydrolase (plasmid) [Azospirillum sp. HJ39]|uniref:phosphohydrolase n=1 Tax=Azospirillum sp. HJ39 TaxID=3159496 RepID=UPI003557BFBB
MITDTIVIYHGGCADGFGAAWAAWGMLGNSAEYVPGKYGEDPPDVTGKDVFLLDFSYKRPALEAMIAVAASVVVLDHHKTAQADLEPLLKSGALDGEFDMNCSGAAMAYKYFFPTESFFGRKTPSLIRHIQDRDLWRFELDGTREIHAALISRPFDFQVWNEFAWDLENPSRRPLLIAEGAAILRSHDKLLGDLLGASTREMVIGGVSVPVANLPWSMASDGGNRLSVGQPFAASYYDGQDARHFSLRSQADGADVSEIARRYDGGGHARAAGFRMPLGWEGDR